MHMHSEIFSTSSFIYLLDSINKSNQNSLTFSHDTTQTLYVTNSWRLTVTAGPRESRSPAGLTQIPDGSSPLGVQCPVQLYSYGYFCTITLTLTLYCPIILLVCQISSILLPPPHIYKSPPSLIIWNRVWMFRGPYCETMFDFVGKRKVI